MSTEKFGDRLRLGMEDLGWNQKRLADETGIDPGAVSRHLKADKPPSSDSLGKYARALGMNEAWLGYNRGSRTAAATAQLQESELEEALRGFRWPSSLPIATMDAIVLDAKKELETTAGKERHRSVWRAWLEQEISRRCPKTESCPGVVRRIGPSKRR